MNKEEIINAPNINRGKPYQLRVCLLCKGTPNDLSNYCKPCYKVFKQTLMEAI